MLAIWDPNVSNTIPFLALILNSNVSVQLPCRVALGSWDVAGFGVLTWQTRGLQRAYPAWSTTDLLEVRQMFAYGKRGNRLQIRQTDGPLLTHSQMFS